MQESIAPVDCTRAAVAVEEFVYPFSLVLILQVMTYKLFYLIIHMCI